MAVADTKSEEIRNACDLLVEDIGPIAVANGAKKMVLNGEHNENDLRLLSILMAVEDADSFYANAFNPIAEKALEHGVRGAIWARELDEFPGGFADMDAKYSRPEHSKHYLPDKEGKTLEPAS